MNQGMLLFFICLLHIATCGSNARFDNYITTFAKKYKDINQYNFRLQIYNFNLQQIAQHNANPTITYDLASSIYSDLADDDFVGSILTAGGKYLQEYKNVPLTTTGKPLNGTPVAIPVLKNMEELDWSKKKLISPVKNQGNCGNSYVFGALGAAQGAVMTQIPIIKVSYSEQQVVDCCKSSSGSSCDGCGGGSMPAVYDFIAKLGITTIGNYPYTSQNGKIGKCAAVCQIDKIASAVPYQRIPPQNLSALYQQLSKKPVAVLVDATNWAEYKGGVFKNCSESMNDNNHAALLVGYDSKGNWILKNSWGEQWGQNGFITLSAGNTCGLSNYALVFNTDVVM